MSVWFKRKKVIILPPFSLGMVTFSNNFLWRGWCLQNPYRIYTVMMQYVIATCQYVCIIQDIQVQIRKCSPTKMLIWPNKPLTSTDPLTSWAVRCVHRIRSAIWCKCGVFTFLHLTFSQFYVHGGICWRSVFFPVRLGSQVLCSIPMVGFTTWIQWRSTGMFDVFLAKHGGKTMAFLSILLPAPCFPSHMPGGSAKGLMAKLWLPMPGGTPPAKFNICGTQGFRQSIMYTLEVYPTSLMGYTPKYIYIPTYMWDYRGYMWIINDPKWDAHPSSSVVVEYSCWLVISTFYISFLSLLWCFNSLSWPNCGISDKYSNHPRCENVFGSILTFTFHCQCGSNPSYAPNSQWLAKYPCLMVKCLFPVTKSSTLWLFNVANWRITIFLIGEPSKNICKWAIFHGYVK